MTIQQFIEKSIKGGYTRGTANKYETLLCPDLWRCAGKEMGWPEKLGQPWLNSNFDWIEIPWCQWKMHCLIDHIFAGKSIESFFESL